MITKEQITRANSIATDGAEAEKLIGTVSRLDDMQRRIIDQLVNNVNQSVRACWDETDGKLFTIYDTEAALKWATLGEMIEVIVSFIGVEEALKRIAKPKRIAIVCGDGYVVDSGFAFDPAFAGAKRHAVAATKAAALVMVQQGENVVRAALAANNP